jgi:hemolysin activation/secretion protein
MFMNKINYILVTNFLICLLPVSVRSEPVIPNAGLLMRESSKIPVQPKESSPAEVEQPTLKKPMPVQNSLRIKVRNFIFNGNSQFTADTLQALLNKYTNRDIGFNDLQQAAFDITTYYRNAGFMVAYAYLPEQTLKDQQVELAIFEGRLDDQHLKALSLSLLNKTRINKSVLQRFLNKLPKGMLITESSMDHLSLLLNQLPGMDAKVVLLPGKEIGTSSLAIKVKEAPLVTGYAATDNYGLYATGYYRFDGGVSINDPFGFGDQLNLRAQTTEMGGTVAGWADYNIAINGYGTRVGVNFSELNYNLGRSFSSLNATGLARTVGASILQPLLLKPSANVTGIAHYEHRWVQDNMDFFGSHNDRELNVMSFSFTGSLTDSLLKETGITKAMINVSAGQVDFTNNVAYLIDKSTMNTNGGYNKFNWVLNRTQDVWGPISLYANFQGQVASKNIDSSERISLGGPYGIRAYPVGEASADEGWLVNTETRYQLPTPTFIPGYMQLIGFIDTGHARILTNPIPGIANNSQFLTGYGFGLNWFQAAGFTLRTSLAWRSSNKQPYSDPTVSGPMGYFQLSRQF